MTLTAGSLVGHFQVEAPLGAGGMGVVYLAEDIHLKRKVALKFLSSTGSADRDAVRRLIREAQVAGTLDHPNIAAVHEIGDWESIPFIALAYCPGITLSERLGQGPLTLSEIISIARQVASGLAHAHAARIVHRDLKPSNIMIGPDGHARILDFGLALPLSAGLETSTRITQDGQTLGTVAYMPPEQIRGQTVDATADIWALGVTVYEMLAGRLPFTGANAFAIMRAIEERPPAPVRDTRPDTPEALTAIVDAALTKDPAARTLTAAEIADTLTRLQASASGGAGERRAWRGRTVAAIAAVLVAGVALGGMAWFQRTSKIRWARETALPQIAQLGERDNYYAAFALAQAAAPYLSGDRELQRQLAAVSRTINIESTPSGADVSYRPYGGKAQPWVTLGRTPIRGLSIPRNLLEWRIEKAGYVPVEDVGLLPRYITLLRLSPDVPHAYVLDTLEARPRGMVRASPRGLQLLNIAGLEHIAPFELEDFWIDRYEVTNRDFKAFVDAGGYGNERYWQQPFVKDGNIVPWKAAMSAFRDTTGRNGPATWEFGSYPEGKDDFPVGGVSWYEAAAYAEFAGKRLPTIFHWSVAADRRATSGVLLARGRFHSDGSVPVGHSEAVSRYGTQDLAGNVKEWCWNEAGGARRYTLGGGWSDPAYFFNDADARSPWDRAPALGFRCVKLTPGHETLAAGLTAPVLFIFRDFGLERPVSDEVFRAFRGVYSYDHGDVAPVVKAVDDSARDWRHEVVEINTAYGERMAVHLLLPKGVAPPYQTLVYFPGIGALHDRSSQNGVSRMLDVDGYVIRSGRAVVYPIYKATHERESELTSDFPATTTLFRDHVVMWSKDLQRTVDYLQTRRDVRHDKIGYLGRSWGAAMGTIMVATEPRLKLAIFDVGGFYAQHARPEVEAINFAPRVVVPSLMLNGRYDFFFPMDSSQRPMFQLIGVPEPHKRWVVYDTSHTLPRQEMIAETLTWLDRYFGRIATP